MRARCNAPWLANFRGRYRVGLSAAVLIVMGAHVVTIEANGLNALGDVPIALRAYV